MNLRFFLTLTAAIFTLVCNAETVASSSANPSWYDSLRESPFIMHYDLEVSNRQDKANRPGRFQGVGFLNLVSPGYRFNANNRLYLMTEWTRHADRGTRDANSNTWNYSQFEYIRSNLLTQESDGVNMDFYFRQRFHPTSWEAHSNESVGYSRPGLVISRRFGDDNQFAFVMQAHTAIYIRQTGEEGKHVSYFLSQPMLSYIPNDRWRFNASFEHISFFNKGVNNDQYMIDPVLEAWYSVNSQVLVGTYLRTIAFQDHDDRLFNRDMVKAPTLILALSASVF